MLGKSFILGSCALITLTVIAAQAGPCTGEIESLTKTMASKDAGSGPTSGSGGTVGSGTPAAGQHPPTTAMSQATQGGAASPQDVRQQTAGQPTAAQQQGTIDVSAALARARDLDKQGKEAECMQAVQQAKQLSGAK
jgi:hypothetical protein